MFYKLKLALAILWVYERLEYKNLRINCKTHYLYKWHAELNRNISTTIVILTNKKCFSIYFLLAFEWISLLALKWWAFIIQNLRIKCKTHYLCKWHAALNRIISTATVHIFEK
jgi:hypothetical protein